MQCDLKHNPDKQSSGLQGCYLTQRLVKIVDLHLNEYYTSEHFFHALRSGSVSQYYHDCYVCKQVYTSKVGVKGSYISLLCL